MKKFNILFLLILGVLLNAQDKSQTSKKEVIELPFEYINNFIYITADINGTQERFIFDSGAANLLSKKFADSRNLSLKKKGNVNGYFGKTAVYETTISSLRIQKLNFKDVNFKVADLKFIDDINVAGLIHPFLFGYSNYSIDFKNLKIILGDSVPNSYDFTFKLKDIGSPRIEIGNNKFLIDTGNPLFGEINGDSVFKDLKCRKFSSNSLSFSNAGLDLCNAELKDYSGKIMSFPSFKMKNPTNVIGNLFWQNYFVHIDTEKNLLFLKNNSYYTIPEDLYFIKGEKEFFVGIINENSDAYKKGLRAGDQLVSVSGFDLSNQKNSVNLHNFLLEKKINSFIVKRKEDIKALNDINFK